MRNLRDYLAPLLLAGCAAATLTAGCGGAGGGRGMLPAGDVASAPAGRSAGTVRFVIKWPTAAHPAGRRVGSRVIPVSAQSIDIVVQDTAGAQLAHKLFVRPDSVQATGQLDITNVPAGTVRVIAKAYPEQDGSGVLQAQGVVQVVVKPSQTATATLAMGSTVTHVKLFENSDTLKVGDSEIIGAAAYDAADEVVMTGLSDWAWSVDTGTYGSFATFNAQGQLANVTAQAPGTYVINAAFVGMDASQASVHQSATLTITGAGSTSHILVLDHGNARLVGMDDMTGKGFRVLGSGVTFHNPTDMALDGAGNIYVAEYQSSDSQGFYPGRIVELDPNGNYVGQLKPKSPPSIVYVDPQNHIYWRDDAGVINRVDNINGDNRQGFGGFGSGLFGDPVGIATDSNGKIYVLDGTGNRVVRVDDMTGGNPVNFGTEGNGRNQFELLDPNTYSGSNHGLAIDQDNHVYVADYGNNRVVRFDANALNDPSTSNFTSIPVYQPFGGGGANYFGPIAVTTTFADPVRIYFTGVETAQRTGASGTNDPINAYVVRADSIGSAGNDLIRFGGPVGSGDGQFKDPVAIAIR